MTIKEVAKRFDLTPDTLRYYEKVGLIGPIEKTKSGIRDYQEEDLNRIEFVKCMRDAELPIDVLVRYLNLFDSGDETMTERKQLLMTERDLLKEKIKDMKNALKKLDMKIEMYDQKILDQLLEKERN